jgi:hypothetical protein
MSVSRWFASIGLAMTAACSLLFPVPEDAASGGDAEADGALDGPDDALPNDSGPDDALPSAPDALPSDGEVLDACKRTSRGPRLLLTERFCIDEDEVTRAQYLEFVAAGLDPAQQSRADCADNTSFALHDIDVDANTDTRAFPALVDFCDAYAFCAWAGKRLCGAINAGPLDLDGGVADWKNRQWAYACAHGEEGRAFPYGNLPIAECGASQHVSEPVGSHPVCNGGYPDLKDMAGSALEWIDACDDGACGYVAVGACRSMGRNPRPTLNGFRCCWP